MKLLLDFLGKLLANLALPFWMTTVHVVAPWKWLTVKRVLKSFFVNVVICSVEGGTVIDEKDQIRRSMTADEKQQAAFGALSALVYAGWIKDEEALRGAIDGGVVQLNALKVLKK